MPPAVTRAGADVLPALVAFTDSADATRALAPVHATVDGDAIVVAATGEVELPETAGPVAVEIVRILAAAAVEEATRSDAVGP